MDLKTRLVHQPLYLRGQWSDDQLKFDAEGRLLGSSDSLPFTLSGIEIDSIKVGAGGLELEAHRIGLEFHKDVIKRADVKIAGRLTTKREAIHVEIQAPANADYTTALNNIFTADLATFVPALPVYWQQYGKEHLLSITASSRGTPQLSTLKDANSDGELKVHQVGGGVTPPRVLHAPEPRFNQQARFRKLSGNVLVYLQVDTVGKPVDVRILKPVGFGLDEMAIEAVSQYQFEPAQENGLPVRVEMNVEVNYKIF